MRPIQRGERRTKIEVTQIAIFASGIKVKPGIAVGIGHRFTQFMGNHIGHGVGAFIPVRAGSLRGTSGTRFGRALGGWVSDKCNFYVSRRERAGGARRGRHRS